MSASRVSDTAAAARANQKMESNPVAGVIPGELPAEFQLYEKANRFSLIRNHLCLPDQCNRHEAQGYRADRQYDSGAVLAGRYAKLVE